MKLSDMKSCGKKDPKDKKRCHYDSGVSRLGVRIVSIKLAYD
jgi:hypothetical protein